jgi:serine/threonine-protein kinase
MAPEQLDGGELGPSTDIFALAVLLMEAWTGSAPFRRATPEECAAAVRQPHPKPSDFDPRLVPLDDAIGRAMNVDPRERQQEASELARALSAFLQGIDVADIARPLGDRVRALREDASVSAPSPSSSASGASTASHGELGTKTFAARERASWSAPTPRGRSNDPAMAIATPLMVDAEALEKIHAGIGTKARAEAPSGPGQTDGPTARRGRGKPSRSPPAATVETIATRPLETPVNSRGPARGRQRPLAAYAVVALAAIGGFVVWRTRGDGPRDVPNPSASLSASHSAEVSAKEAPPVMPSAVEAEPVAIASSRAVAKSSATATVTAAGAGSAVATNKAAVTLLGEPGTRVWIDGVARGACPARAALDPGAHEVRFTFDPTGESLLERVTVKSGERATVRAEFTGAAPTVRIQR